jgi:hypothetical protein
VRPVGAPLMKRLSAPKVVLKEMLPCKITISNNTRTIHEREGERFRRKLAIIGHSWR